MIEYQESTHIIDGVTFKFVKCQPTKMGESTVRRLMIGDDADPEYVSVQFSAEGFELFKAIIREY
jgi:hypothetical protein